MKKYLILLATLVSTSVMANGYNSGTTNDASSGSESYSGSVAIAESNGVNDSYNTAGTDLSNAVPQAIAPSLTTTLTETCMGSTSFGGSGAGFGVSFGTTWRDSACVRRLDARELATYGDRPTAREMMCDSAKVREAALRSGRPCVADGGVAAYDVRATTRNGVIEKQRSDKAIQDAKVSEKEAAAVLRQKQEQQRIAQQNQISGAGPVYRAE